ncbi:MAG: hypothetical protein VW378_01215 [bacterium]
MKKKIFILIVTCVCIINPLYCQDIKREEKIHISASIGKIKLNKSSTSTFLQSAWNESNTQIQYSIDADIAFSFLGPYRLAIASSKSSYNGEISGKTSELRIGFRYYTKNISKIKLMMGIGVVIDSKSEYRGKDNFTGGYRVSTGGTYTEIAVIKNINSQFFIKGNIGNSKMNGKEIGTDPMAGGLNYGIGLGYIFLK